MDKKKLAFVDASDGKLYAMTGKEAAYYFSYQCALRFAAMLQEVCDGLEDAGIRVGDTAALKHYLSTVVLEHFDDLVCDDRTLDAEVAVTFESPFHIDEAKVRSLLTDAAFDYNHSLSF